MVGRDLVPVLFREYARRLSLHHPLGLSCLYFMQAQAKVALVP
jgi:hypothetical protein